MGVEQALKSEPPSEYLNGDGEVVSWPLAAVLDIQRFPDATESGHEVAGAIASLEELSARTRERTG